MGQAGWGRRLVELANGDPFIWLQRSRVPTQTRWRQRERTEESVGGLEEVGSEEGEEDGLERGGESCEDKQPRQSLSVAADWRLELF